MNTALIIHHSKTGTTKEFGRRLADFCNLQGINYSFISIEEYTKENLEGVDYLFLGCWTHGHFIFNQHPDPEWVAFATKLPNLTNRKIVLFTTYKIATGSMFRKMKEHLKFNTESMVLELKSRNGHLKKENYELLRNTINQLQK